MLISNDLVVFSMDLTITRSLGVIGELACFRGLKFRITVKILFAMWGRARIKIEREFRVASTSTASLLLLAEQVNIEENNRPDAVLEDAQHSIQQTGGFGFEISRRNKGVVLWHHRKRNFERMTTLRRKFC